MKRDKTGTEIRLWGISQVKGEKTLQEGIAKEGQGVGRRGRSAEYAT